MTQYQRQINQPLTLADFANELQNYGLILKGPPIISGDIVRVPTSDDHNGDRTGWYSLHEIDHGLIYGYFGDWRTGSGGRWCNRNSHAMAPAQTAKLKIYRDRIKAERDKEQKAAYSQAASLAAAIWAEGKDVLQHPYLIKKGVQAMARISTDPSHYEGWLMIPLIDGNGYFSTIQFINNNGEKRFLSDGKKKGCYHLVEPDSAFDKIYIAEGYATALTINEATGAAVAMACDCGNLEPVAEIIRSKYPFSKVIISGDNDHEKPANFGKTKAIKAAAKIGAVVTLPECGPGETDFNDVSASKGLAEVKRQLQNTTKPPETGLKIIKGHEVKMQEINWLWPGWLAGGKLQILAGQAGTGKTTIALALAATLSTAGQWPDNSPARQGAALIWSGEDGIADSLIPRLVASGADLKNIYFVGNIQGEDRPFDPSTDIPDLLNKARRIPDLKLIIIDPVVSAVAGDSHKNAEVRRGLQPIVDMAGEIGAAVIGITHFTKGTKGSDPTERVTGSLAFGALARLVMCTAKGAEIGQSRRLVRSKSNIGPDGGGFEYDLTRIDVAPGIEGQTVLWGNPLTGTALSLLSDIEDAPKEKTAVDEAGGWLEDVLRDGPMTSKEIKATANECGHAWATVQRARVKIDKVDINRTGSGHDMKTLWTLKNHSFHSFHGSE